MFGKRDPYRFVLVEEWKLRLPILDPCPTQVLWRPRAVFDRSSPVLTFQDLRTTAADEASFAAAWQADRGNLLVIRGGKYHDKSCY